MDDHWPWCEKDRFLDADQPSPYKNDGDLRDGLSERSNHESESALEFHEIKRTKNNEKKIL